MSAGSSLPGKSGLIPNHPLRFVPQPKERIWGGNRLRELFAKDFPVGRPIGESWEVADRPDAVSVVAEGPFRGTNLRQLMEAFPDAMVGTHGRADGRFPWLAKLLDAQDDLSVQVHPPAHLAASMGGEPKTEIWYVAAAQPGSRLVAGLRPGVTLEEFIARSQDGTVLQCCQLLPVEAGDVLFVPSGRVHALGAGIVIFELQQNSDTTYRVYDFGRLGLDGRPRELHLAESLKAIDFQDFNPQLVERRPTSIQPGSQRPLNRAAVFNTTELHGDEHHPLPDLRPARSPGLLAVVQGELEVSGGNETLRLPAGGFCLLPAALMVTSLRCVRPSVVLQLTVGSGS